MGFLLLFFIFLFGLIMGSFLNCLVWRIHKKETLWGRSYCPSCRHKIHWYDNIPVVSFIVLKAKCRNCKGKISLQYPIIELVTGLLFLLSFYFLYSQYNPLTSSPNIFAIELLKVWMFIFALIVIFIYDARWQEVPMSVLWPISVVLFILNIFLPYYLGDVFVSALIAVSFFSLQYFLTRKKGLGEGDIWISLMMAIALVSWRTTVLAIFIAYLIGSLVAIYFLINKKKGLKSKIALGPFLVLGSIIALFWGDKILAWYSGLLIF